MAVPDFQSFFRPMLEALADGAPRSLPPPIARATSPEALPAELVLGLARRVAPPEGIARTVAWYRSVHG